MDIFLKMVAPFRIYRRFIFCFKKEFILFLWSIYIFKIIKQNYYNMRILIFLPSGIGDILFLSPSIFALKNLTHDVEITAIVPRRGFNKFLLQHVFPIKEILFLDRPKKISIGAIVPYIKHIVTIAKKIRREQFDIAIAPLDVRVVDQYYILLRSKAHQRIGYRSWGLYKNRLAILLNKIIETNLNKHVYHIHFDIIKKLKPEFKIEDYMAKAANTLKTLSKPKNLGEKPNPLVTIFPGSGGIGADQQYKRWDFMNYIQITKHLIEKTSCHVAFLGGRGEYDESLIPLEIAHNERFHNMTGKLSFEEIIGNLLQTELVISNDNGLLHLAEFLDVPTIGIYAANWSYLSKRFFSGDTAHKILTATKEDLADYYWLTPSWMGNEFDKKYKSLLEKIHPKQIIDELPSSIFS